MKYTWLMSGLACLAGVATATAQVAIPASFAHPLSEVNTRGFKVRVVQANTTSGTLATTVARAEGQLAGTVIDPVTSQPYVNEANLTGFNPDGTYDENVVIDYEQSGGSTSGLFIPGIPGGAAFDNTDNIALEVLAWLELAPGTYQMGVNSDDGFRVTVGLNARDKASEVELGVYDGARSAGDTVFSFTISQAGAYSFRLVYFEGNGGANVKWFTVDSASNQILINDTSTAGAVKAYRQFTGASAGLPYVQLLTPGVGANGVLPGVVLGATIVDGTTAQVVPASVELWFDDTHTVATATKSGSKTSIGFDPPGLLVPSSVHPVKLVYTDTATPANVRTIDYTFTTSDTGNITLPAPFYFEDFETVAEEALPAGWTVQNFTDGDLAPDLNDPNSDSYKNWVVISRSRMASITAWNASQRLNTQPQYVNGIEVTNLMDGNFIYAESDIRSGSQVQYLFTPDINCSGKSNVFVSYHSAYTQNQDNIDALEYSIDSGATWLPIVYMIDAADLIKSGETVDGYATLNEPRTDTATYLDPDTQEQKGGYYGAFIGVASNLWSTLGPNISGRINDDQLESKRVELFRLTQADNQAKVRFRFAQAGTASWFWGVDSFGLYEIAQPIAPKVTKQPDSQLVSVGAAVELSVTATGTEPLSYQWKQNGATLVGQIGAKLVLNSVQVSDAGDYTVVVKNAAGEASSAVAKIAVFSGTVLQDLVVHLKFDDSLADASGHNNNGTAVGAPTFAAGKIGKAVHVPSGTDYVTLGTPADLNFGTSTDFAIAFWAKLEEWSGDPSFIGNKDWNSGGNQGYVLAADDDAHFQWNLAGAPGSRKDYDGPPGVLTNGWHHVAVVFWRTANAMTFVDGVLVDSRPMTASQNNLDTPAAMATNIGQDGTGTYGSVFTNLDMDDTGVWRRALTAQEVAAIYAAGQTGKDLSTAAVVPPTQFSIKSVGVAGGNITITWDAAADVRLQKAAGLTNPDWQLVPNTAGVGTFTEAVQGTGAFYHLTR